MLLTVVSSAWQHMQKMQDNQILMPSDLYSWAKENSKSVNLQSRFDVVQPIQGTGNYHAFIPITETSLVMKNT
jgi:hypothetical protein